MGTHPPPHPFERVSVGTLAHWWQRGILALSQLSPLAHQVESERENRIRYLRKIEGICMFVYYEWKLGSTFEASYLC